MLGATIKRFSHLKQIIFSDVRHIGRSKPEYTDNAILQEI